MWEPSLRSCCLARVVYYPSSDNLFPLIEHDVLAWSMRRLWGRELEYSFHSLIVEFS